MQAGPSKSQTATASPAITDADVAAANLRLHAPSLQPVYPDSASRPTPAPAPAPAHSLIALEPPPPPPATLAAAANPQLPVRDNNYFPQSPFRNRALHANPFQRPLRRISSARLWNPTNSTPRTSPSRRPSLGQRRRSTPPPPIPLSLPAPDDSGDGAGVGFSDVPLLTLLEQRQSRHSLSTVAASIQVERSGGGLEQRVSLPKLVRRSVDDETRHHVPAASAAYSRADNPYISGPSKEKGLATVTAQGEESSTDEDIPRPKVTGLRKKGQSISRPGPRRKPRGKSKGKGRAIMASPDHDDGTQFDKDVERGPDVLPGPRDSTTSMPPGIGSAISLSSSSNSSIMGDDPDQHAAEAGGGGEDWGPQHPCYPHLNPHVPLESPLYASTRVVRIRRDWLLEGDLAPTFSNLYPEILDPAGLSEQEFRRVIEKLNSELVPAFNPYSFRNVLDGMLGLLTGWLWEDAGLTAAKTRLRRLERWIERWNAEMERHTASSAGSDGDIGILAPKIVPLRRTGYMTLDIQIPDPEIAPAAPSTPGASRSGQPYDPAPVAVES